MSSLTGLFDALDPPSRVRVRIFGFKLLVLFPFSMLLAVRFHLNPFGEIALCAFWYGLFSGLVALVRREPVGGPSLNGWDELLAFLALKCLAQFMAVAAG
jgi:hypothetical protein